MRRSPALFAVLSVLLVGLAGCSGKGTAGDDESSTSSTSTTGTPDAPAAPTNGTGNATVNATALAPDLEFADCRNWGGVFPIPMEAARNALPADFEPVPAGDPTGGARLYAIAIDCETSRMQGEDQGHVLMAYAELAVVPPDQLKVPGTEDYTVPLAFIADNPLIGAQLAAFGLPNAGEGDLGWTASEPTGTHAITATLGAVTLTFAAEAPPAGGGTALPSGPFALFAVQGGQVVSRIQAQSMGGTGGEAAVAFHAAGLPALEQATPADAGFAVQGFALEFRLA